MWVSQYSNSLVRLLSNKGVGLLSGPMNKQAFESSDEAMRAFRYPEDSKEKRKAKRYLDQRVRVRRKRAKLIERAKRRLGKYSPALLEATELWLVNDALAALCDQYCLSADDKGRRIYLRCLRHIERLKNCN